MGRRRRILGAACAALIAVMPATGRAAESIRQQALFEWDRTTIDVVILPPGHGQIYNDGGILPAGAGDLDPLSNSYARAAERGVRLWRPAVDTYGPAWLRAALRITVSVAGRDSLPAEPEIVVVFGETTGPILGTSMGDGPCVAAVSKLYRVSFTANDVTNIVAHETGHCLGLAHLDQPVPKDDLLQTVYQHPDGFRSTPVHCPSNLNVATLERVFKRAAGQGPGGGTTVMDPSAYRQSAAC